MNTFIYRITNLVYFLCHRETIDKCFLSTVLAAYHVYRVTVCIFVCDRTAKLVIIRGLLV